MLTSRKKKKKRTKHAPSIMHRKDGTCYLCEMLNRDFRRHLLLEKHHVFPGKPGRRISEENGFTVWLCPEHHRTGPAAVHNCHENLLFIQKNAQLLYERDHTHSQWMALMGKNYL